MKKLIPIILILVMALATFSCHVSQPPSNTYYLTHISLIDVIKGRTLQDMTVAITDSIISSVISTSEMKIHRKAKVINCKGKFIIPGLWDMHVHLGNATGSALPLFFANGVTGVRDMGSKHFDSIQNWKKQINHRQLTGPRIISPGPVLNGGYNLPDFQIGVNTEEEARHMVDSLTEIGVDFIKIQGGLTKEIYYAIAKESEKLHISFAGHVPASSSAVAITGEEASEAGQRSLEHMLGIPFARDTIKMYQHMYPTEESLKHLFEVLLKNGTFVTPTLSVYYIPANYISISEKQSTLLKYISPELKSFWDIQIVDWPNRNKSFMDWLLKARMNMIPILRDAGIPLLAGTDTGFPFVIPGFGLREELNYLVMAGLSPLEALKTATINPAIFLGNQNQLGSTEKGKRADLVILNADPASNIQNLQSIEAVIVNGELFDRSALNNELMEVVNKVNRNH